MSGQSSHIGNDALSPEAKGEEKLIVVEEEPHMLPVSVSGGYYPLNLGETLKVINPGPQVAGGRFKVVRKLGWGRYSSVWLAESHGCKNIYTRYQALKVLTKEATAGILNEQFPEFTSLAKVASTNIEHPGYLHCAAFLGRMIVGSKIGPHFCFLFEPMGDLQALQRQQSNGVFSVAITKKIIKQTLLALDYIHTECKLVHTDLKLDNMLISLGKKADDNVDEEINDYLLENPSQSYEPRVDTDLSPEPIITVKSQPLPNFGLDPDLSNLRVKLADFGVALNLNPENLTIGRQIQPHGLKAPEIVLGHVWSTQIDIWTLGCMVFECLVGAHLFQNPMEPGQLSYTDVYLLRIIQLLHPFPEDFLARCANRAEYFDEIGHLLRLPQCPSKTIESFLDNYGLMRTEDLGPAADFIRKCLTIDPAARPAAHDLLNDEWLKGV